MNCIDSTQCIATFRFLRNEQNNSSTNIIVRNFTAKFHINEGLYIICVVIYHVFTNDYPRSIVVFYNGRHIAS